MADLLFEIGTEELPASFIDPALAFMQSAIVDALEKARIQHGAVVVEGTPRRLVLMVRDVAERQTDLETEVTGPKAEIAFDASGSLTKVGEGFAKSRGLTLADLFRKDTPKGAVIAARVKEHGLRSDAVLPDILLAMMKSIPFAKTMRWESSGVRFARPVRWVLALLGSDVLRFQFGDVQSGNQTCGHRFLAPEFVTVDGIDGYLAWLEKSFVMLARAKRRETIAREAAQVALRAGGQLRQDDALLDIVCNLVEYPWPILGRFGEEFLRIPKEILISEMREHQKYFAVEDKAGNLLPAFVVVMGTMSAEQDAVARGNARVLRARFEDGAFYYQDDLKTPLAARVPALQRVLFQRELGTLFDKTERIRVLSAILCKMLGLACEVDRAAQLCKADLVSGVVGEFTHLQGTMGRIYALHDGESAVVARAIEQHYWPRFSGDLLPEDDVGAVVGLADRLDTLVGVIGIGKMPKGTADPFALRRAAIAISRILIERGYRLSLTAAVSEAVKLFGAKVKLPAQEVVSQAVTFIQTRAKGYIKADVRVVDGAAAIGADDLVDWSARIEALASLQNKNPEIFERFVATLKRAGNIVAKARVDGLFKDGESFHRELFKEGAERDLFAAIMHLENHTSDQRKLSKAQLGEHYGKVLYQVAEIKPLVDRFFDDVMVMVDDIQLRQARLGLLAELEKVARQLADFTRMSLD